MTKKLRDVVVSANVRHFRDEQAVDDFPAMWRVTQASRR
jgi:hypothetical protein